MKLTNQIKLLSLAVLSISFCSCLSTMLSADPNTLPKVYTINPYVCEAYSYSHSVNPQLDSQTACFLPSDLNPKELPSDFVAPVIYPEKEIEKYDTTQLDGTDIAILFLCVNSKSEIEASSIAYSKDSFLKGLLQNNKVLKIKPTLQKIVEGIHEENKSNIVSIVVKQTWSELKDLGAVQTIEKEKFPDSYQLDKVHAFYIDWDVEVLESYTKFETFEGDDAITTFKYGKIEMINVKSPVGNFKINKSEIPSFGLEEEVEKRIYYSTKAIPENKFAFEFDENNSTDLMEALLSLYDPCGPLNIEKEYILSFKIVKDCGNYFLTETGWKVYPASETMKKFIRGYVGKRIYGASDKICMQVRILQNGNDYELVLQPHQFSYFY